jgi:hypothetical protein
MLKVGVGLEKCLRIARSRLSGFPDAAGGGSTGEEGRPVKRTLLSAGVLAVVALIVAPAGAAPQEARPAPAENFFAKSLHFTNRGIEFVYSKGQGGVERLTGVPFKDTGCSEERCHVRTCDVCHKKEVDGKASYTVDPEVAQKACDGCHGAEPGIPDVHRAKGMKCMSCHSVREVHGDGVAHDSYMQPGVLETHCEKCHAEIGKSVSHAVHKARLDCAACHTDRFENCLNCHLDTRLAGKKGGQISLAGMLFLVNRSGRVTTANFLTYVYRGKTMITFAPSFSHSITKQGRRCADCHGSQIVRDIAGGTFVPVRWENGRASNVKGVIPVIDGMTWNVPFLDYSDGKWTPLPNPAPPLLNYSGSCSPLSKEQLAKLVKPRGAG